MFGSRIAALLMASTAGQGSTHHPYEHQKPDAAAVEWALDLTMPHQSVAAKRLRISALRCRTVAISRHDPGARRGNLEAVARCSYKISRISAAGWGRPSPERAVFVYQRHACGGPGQETDLMCYFWTRESD